MFQPTGLRSFVEYRDLGIVEATGGEYNAQVVRALPGDKGSTGWHTTPHPPTRPLPAGVEDIAFEDGRLVRLVAGTCVNIPPGVGHNEIGYSDDFEALVIFAPESFETVSIPDPATAALVPRDGSSTAS